MDIAEWKVEILPSAQKDLDGLDDRVRFEAMKTILDLADDPFPAGFIPMEGFVDLYRIKFYSEQFRIVYQVQERRRKVIVTRVGPRGTIYSGLFPFRR